MKDIDKEKEQRIWELLAKRCDKCRDTGCEGYQTEGKCDPVEDILCTMDGQPSMDQMDRIIKELEDWLRTTRDF